MRSKKQKIKIFTYRGYQGVMKVTLYHKWVSSYSLYYHEIFTKIEQRTETKLCTSENLIEKIQKMERSMEHYIDSLEFNETPLENTLHSLGFN